MTPYFDDGQIRIWHADCRDILPTLEPDSIDLVLTDPPYSSLDVEVSVGTTTRLIGPDHVSGKRLVNTKRLSSSTGKRWFSTIPPEELTGIWPICQRLLADTGALYVFADVKSGLELFPALNPANVIVWDKRTIGMGFNWRRMHEWIAFCPMSKHVLRDKSVGDILRFSGVQEKEHPTQKPTGLLKAILLNSTDIADLVLDPFMGVGSTLRAAKDLGRKAIGIEIEERYCEIAVKRLQQAVLPLEVGA